MGLFDRFRKKAPPPASPGQERPAVDPDTMALLLFGTVIGAEPVAQAVRDAFGPGAVLSVDNSHPRVPALSLELEGVEFFCSCMPMPHPPEICDLSQTGGGLFSPEERETLLAHRSFLVLAQKGGGTSLAEKRRICRLFTRLAGVLMALDEAAGVYVNEAELLISRRIYLHHAALLSENERDPNYFPAPLWIGIRHGKKGGHNLVGTWGLRQFGFLELWFLNAPCEWAELHERLYLMSIFQITGRELYQDRDTIEFTKGSPSVFQELHGALFITGGE